MPPLPFMHDSQPPPRRPAVRLLAPSVDAGELGSRLESLRIERVAAPGRSRARLRLSAAGDSPVPGIGDRVQVSLGYAGQLSAVFSGRVVAEQRHAGRHRDLLLGGADEALDGRYLNQSYREQNFSDLLQQWVAEAGVVPGTLERGADYPFLAIDDRRSLWAWAATLATDAGLLVTADAEDRLQARQPEPRSSHELHWGEQLLACNHSRREAALDSVTLHGEGAAGSQGAGAWSWLTSDPAPLEGSAGNGPRQRSFSDGRWRSRAVVQGAADARAARLQRAAGRVRARVTGIATLAIGQRVSLGGLPGGHGDGEYLLTRVRHRYDATGFTSEIEGSAA